MPQSMYWKTPNKRMLLDWFPLRFKYAAATGLLNSLMFRKVSVQVECVLNLHYNP